MRCSHRRRLWGRQANNFRKDLRQRGFQYLAHSIDLTMETLRKDWFHKTADKEALKLLAPDFTKASMRFGVVHGLPHADVPKIFFGINGLVHRKLYGWNRIKGRALTVVHASGEPPAAAKFRPSKTSLAGGRELSACRGRREPHGDGGSGLARARHDAGPYGPAKDRLSTGPDA